jgi:hypothetical protein
MAFNPYSEKYRPSLINTHDQYVVNAFDQAGAVMNETGCDPTAFLEIKYDGGGNVRRIWDDQRVNDLSERERLRLFPQLNGLFKLAVNNKLYPL